MSVKITLVLTPEVIAAIQKAGDDDSPLPPAARRALIDAVALPRVDEWIREPPKSVDKSDSEGVVKVSATKEHTRPQADGNSKAALLPAPNQRPTRDMPQSNLGSWDIIINGFDGKKIAINGVGPNTTIDCLVDKYCEKETVLEREDLRFIFAGRELPFASEEDRDYGKYLGRTLSDVSAWHISSLRDGRNTDVLVQYAGFIHNTHHTSFAWFLIGSRPTRRTN